MTEPRFFYLLHRAQHALLKYSEHHLGEELGVTPAQLGALFFLRKSEGCQLKDLSRGLGLNNSAITGLVHRMEAQGLVLRRPCEDDGRAFRLFMTPLGREKAEAGIPLVREMNELLREDFTEEELEIAARFLQTVMVRLEKPRELRQQLRAAGAASGTASETASQPEHETTKGERT